MRSPAMRFLTVVFLAACATAGAPAEKGQRPDPPKPAGDPPARAPAGPILIRGATILTASGKRIDDGALLLENGKIAKIGSAWEMLDAKGVRVIEAAGRFVTPGLIDTHSHLGVYASPNTPSHSDGNEVGSPNT